MFRTAERSTSGKGVFRDAGSREGGLFRSEGPPAGGMERYHVSAVDDPEEIRAERTADQVMGGGIFREAGGSGAEGGMGLEGGEAQLPSADLVGPGSALPAGLQESMGAAMGADFSGVRVHTGAGADRANRSLSARAFTQGQDVYFRAGEYDPASREGQHLIAHELAHVADGTEGLHRDPTTSGSTAQPAAGSGNSNQTPAQGQGPAYTVEELENQVEDTKATIIDRNKALESLLQLPQTELASKAGEINNLKTSMGEIKNSSLSLVQKITNKLGAGGLEERQKRRLEHRIEEIYQLIEKKVEPMMKELEKLTGHAAEEDDAPMPDAVKDMVTSPYFDAFLRAVKDLRSAAGEGFGKAEEAASEQAKAHKSKMSAEDKRAFIQKQDGTLTGLSKAEDPSKWKGKAGKVISAVGSSGGELSDDIGAAREADIMHKTKDKEASKEEGERASGAVKASAQGLEAIGASLSAAQNRQDAREQQEKGEKAKQGLKMMARRLRRTLPTESAGNQPRTVRILAVCSQVEQGEKKSGEEPLENLIFAAMDDDEGLEPALSPQQKTLLGSMLAMEKSRASREKKAGALNKAMMFDIANVVSSALQSAGNFVSTFGDGLLGAGLNLLGKAVGQIVGTGKDLAEDLAGGDEEEDENEAKMAASRSAIQQMAALPELTPENKTKLTDKAKNNQSTVPTSVMVTAEQYAEAFYTIESSNVNMSDILFAVEKGGFGKETTEGGRKIKKSTAASMRDMYKNLSFS